MLPKVLVVEDEEKWRTVWGIGFSEDQICEPIFATSIKLARSLFAEHKGELALIVMDACVNSTGPNTQELTREIRAEFAGTILAASSMPAYSQALVDVGASEAVVKSKVPERLKELLSTGK